jgi:hypothetical protein
LTAASELACAADATPRRDTEAVIGPVPSAATSDGGTAVLLTTGTTAAPAVPRWPRLLVALTAAAVASLIAALLAALLAMATL